MEIKEYYLADEQGTIEFGERIGQKLRGGEVVLLSGDLGVGKTHLTKGIVRGLGSSDIVTSPSFALVNSYVGRVPIYHLDLYRLDKLEELEDIGFYDLCAQGAVVIVEWADKFSAYMPADSIKIAMHRIENKTDRKISLEAKHAYISD